MNNDLRQPKNDVSTKQLNGGLNGGLNDRQNIVFDEIVKSGGINASELSQKLNIPFSTIDKYTRIFLKNGLIERRGSKKTGGYWLLK